MLDFIDYSQYRTWSKCPWAWYWRYVRGWAKKFEGQRKDAMCIGSLVHNGLENAGRNGIPKITDECVAENNPTPEALSAARDLVEEYVRLYPNEEWEIQRFEEPLTWEFAGGHPKHGLAKVDAYFYNPEQRTIESGLPGYQLVLTPGWWVREYKTKDAGLNRANWNQGWEVNMQASFQSLALRAKIGEPVQGVLVSVLEKPRLYVPKRKCKGCAEQFEMGLYLSTGTGEHACPSCGAKQKLSAYEPKVRMTPQFYRVVAVRNEVQLAQAEGEIVATAERMAIMETYSKEYIPPTRENCVHPIYGACEFYRLDTYRIPPEEDDSLEPRDPIKYVQLGVV